MNYILTKHAEGRLKERKIPISLLDNTLQNPTKVMYDNHGRLLFVKLYKKGSSARLLLAVVVLEDRPKVVTVIDTSKVKKYL